MISANALAELCARTTASLFSSTLGAEWQVALSCASNPAPQSPVAVRFAASKDLTGELAFVLAPAEAVVLAQRFMGESVGAGDLTTDQREAIDELFRQLVGQLSTALKPSAGEVELHFLGGDAPAWTPAATFCLNAVSEGQPPLSIELWLDPAIVGSLSSDGSFERNRRTDSTHPLDAANIDLLMEVELPVTLRFGQRQMRLSEVVDLASGAVIELDRRVEDPVDLLVDGKVVARGEVVVVDGCYGLRVTEVASPGQRVWCLK